MTGRQLLLGLLTVVLVAAACWFAITALNMARFGPEDADPAVHWIAFGIVLGGTVALVWGAWRVAGLMRDRDEG
jgi:hypothetical protein